MQPQSHLSFLSSYNDGQKSWDTFAFLVCFPIHTGPIAPLTPQKKLDGQIFFRVATLYRVRGGGGGTTRKFQKGCPVLLGNPEKKYDYCITLPRTFVHDCSYPSNPSHLSHHSALYFPLTSHPNHPRYPYYFSRCSYPTHPSQSSQSTKSPLLSLLPQTSQSTHSSLSSQSRSYCSYPSHLSHSIHPSHPSHPSHPNQLCHPGPSCSKHGQR